MNFPLYKMFIKKNWKLLLIFTFIHVFYLSVIALMATDEMMVESMSFLNMEIDVALLSDVDLALWVTTYSFHGLIIFIFSMIYYVLISHKTVFKSVDNTSLSSFLTASISRRQYLITAAMFLFTSLLGLYLVILVVGLLCLLNYGSFAIWPFLNMHLTVFLCSVSVASVVFACSAIFAGSRLGVGLLAGIPIGFGALLMLSSYVEFFKWLTPFGWIDATKITTGTFQLWWLLDLIYATVITVSVFLSLRLFKKKQLSI